MNTNDLLIQIGDENQSLSVSKQMIEDAERILAKMDRDMDQGWQLGKIFIARPTRLQRCQIVANRMLTGLINGNQASAMLMAAYILSRLPGVRRINLNIEGEAEETQFYDEDCCVIL